MRLKRWHVVLLLVLLTCCGDTITMADKPTERVDWADSAASGRVASDADIDAFRPDGYPVRFTPPSPLLNKQWQVTGDWIEYLDDISDEHTTLQALIEASNLQRDMVGSTAVIHPRYLNQTWTAPGTRRVAPATLGDLGTGPFIVDADGRYVAVVTGAAVSVLNSGDLTTKYNISLSGTPIGDITAIAIDGFSLAIAYDGVIEMWDLTDGSLDTDFGTAGVYTHDGSGSGVVNAMLFARGNLHFVGNPADGTGDTSAGKNFVRVRLSGFVEFEETPIAGTGQKIAFWNRNFGILTDDSGTPRIAVVEYDDSDTLVTHWSDELSAWNDVQDIAINGEFFAVSGREKASDDATVKVYHATHSGSSLSAPIACAKNFDTAATWNLSVELDDRGLIVIADSDSTSIDSKIVSYRITGDRGPNAQAYFEIDATPELQSGYGFSNPVHSGTGAGRLDVTPEPPAQIRTSDARVIATVASSGSRTATASYSPTGTPSVSVSITDASGTLTDGSVMVTMWWDEFGMIEQWSRGYSGANLPRAHGYDLNHLYVLDDDAGGALGEEIEKISTGRPPGWWRAADRDNDETQYSAIPMFFGGP